ncbi:hypothetical protein EJP02_009 [Escherichia phage EJP2]|nr:hypothetical protein EJP02_009 [Escherichia phage EJP2]
MIHVELSTIKELFYKLGQAGEYPTNDTARLFNSLDNWQKGELSEAWRQGKEDQKALAK